MTTTLYDTTIPTLIRALNEQISFLKKGEQWCKDNGKDESVLLEGKLAEDMKPLPFQIQRCSDVAKGITYRLGSSSETSIPDDEKTFPQLYARLEKTIEILKEAKKEGFKGPEDNVHMKVGPFEVDFTGQKFVGNYVLPNFFFHHTAAYLILRNAGVPVGKGDYLGIQTITQ